MQNLFPKIVAYIFGNGLNIFYYLFTPDPKDATLGFFFAPRNKVSFKHKPIDSMGVQGEANAICI